MRVDLVTLGGHSQGSWPHGETLSVAATPADVATAMSRVAAGAADACLFWDPVLGAPPTDAAWFSRRRAEVVHAGLALGTSGAPIAMDYIQPTWMWNRDPDPRIAATSWRISLRACLVTTDVIRQLGGIRPEFRTLDGAALELGHRYLTCGAFVRHEPFAKGSVPAVTLPLFDEVLFARLAYGDFWARWALGRGLLNRDYAIDELVDAWSAFRPQRGATRIYVRSTPRAPASASARVSIIVPTIERYSYLRVLLEQLAAQTVPAHEILIIDQTPVEARETTIEREFPALPVQVHYQDTPGQCTARNRALELATGDHLLFLDDDDEVKPDLIEQHLRCLSTFGAEVSCGVSEEAGRPVPSDQQFVRGSDILSTNNTMVRLDALVRSGLFDLAFDRKKCEDKDLGIRLYLDGAFAVLDPAMTVIHHHAPRGGLRVHGTRAVTRESSRARIRDRNLPHMSETYLAMRYFTERQVREAMFLRTWGTLRGKGSVVHRTLKLGYGLAMMPRTLQEVHAAERSGRELFASFPQIATLAK